jgi:hypothetical protein
MVPVGCGVVSGGVWSGTGKVDGESEQGRRCRFCDSRRPDIVGDGYLVNGSGCERACTSEMVGELRSV